MSTGRCFVKSLGGVRNPELTYPPAFYVRYSYSYYSETGEEGTAIWATFDLQIPDYPPYFPKKCEAVFSNPTVYPLINDAGSREVHWQPALGVMGRTYNVFHGVELPFDSENILEISGYTSEDVGYRQPGTASMLYGPTWVIPGYWVTDILVELDARGQNVAVTVNGVDYVVEDGIIQEITLPVTTTATTHSTGELIKYFPNPDIFYPYIYQPMTLHFPKYNPVPLSIDYTT